MSATSAKVEGSSGEMPSSSTERKRGHGGCGGRSEGNPRGNEAQAPPHHQADHIAPARAERHAHADFAGAVGHGITE
jgi:hypothetical protein